MKFILKIFLILTEKCIPFNVGTSCGIEKQFFKYERGSYEKSCLWLYAKNKNGQVNNFNKR